MSDRGWVEKMMEERREEDEGCVDEEEVDGRTDRKSGLMEGS
jgi:hypothetical protein